MGYPSNSLESGPGLEGLACFLEGFSCEVSFLSFVLDTEGMMNPKRKCGHMSSFGIVWNQESLGESSELTSSISPDSSVDETSVAGEESKDVLRPLSLVAVIMGGFSRYPELCWPISMWHFPCY